MDVCSLKTIKNRMARQNFEKSEVRYKKGPLINLQSDIFEKKTKFSDLAANKNT